MTLVRVLTMEISEAMPGLSPPYYLGCSLACMQFAGQGFLSVCFLHVPVTSISSVSTVSISLLHSLLSTPGVVVCSL